MTDGWKWDDAQVPDSDCLLRRVRNIPDQIVPNLTTGELGLKRGAFTYDPHSGISTQSSVLLQALGIPRSDIYNWSTHYGVEFCAGEIREANFLGVIYDPDEADDRLGPAHASVRNPDPAPPRATRKLIFQRIADSCRIMPEDPHG